MLKTILQFFALGSILFAGQVALSRYLESDTISLTVEVSPELSAYRTEQVIKNAILLDYAVQLGWHETDPVIRKHLVRSMKFAELFDCEHMSEGELVAEAVKIGLPKSDAVVRARLLQRAESSLAALRESQQPTDEDLARYLEAHRDLFMHKPRYSFGHVFLSRARRGGELLDEADRVKAVLESQPDLNPEEAAGLGDSLIRSRPYETRTVADATAAYGQSFAEALTAAPIGLWTGPVESAFGAHLIRLAERSEAELPPLADVENQVRGRLLRELREKNSAERYAKLRAAYEITVVETQ